MNIFWPTDPWPENCEIGARGRLGRALHWAALVLAALVVLFILATWGDPVAMTVEAALAVAIALVGRGLRYILADE